MPELLTSANLAYDGVYRFPTTGSGAPINWPSGAISCITFRPSDGHIFAVGRPNDGYPIVEMSFPVSDPSFTTTWSSAPAMTYVQEFAPNWAGVIAATDDINGIDYDPVDGRFWITFGDSYGGTGVNCLAKVDLSGGTPVVYGPWRNSYSFQLGRSQTLAAPSSLTAISPNYGLICSGRRDNTFQSGSWGTGMIWMDKPTISTPPNTIMATKKLSHWAFGNHPSGPNTPSQSTPSGQVIAGSSGCHRPTGYNWEWIEWFGTGANYYRRTPYERISIASDYWGTLDNAGYFVWVDFADVHGVLYFGTICLGGMWYGYWDSHAQTAAEVGSPSGYVSWQIYPSSFYNASNHSSGVDTSVTPNTHHVYSQWGGNRGNRSEDEVPILRVLDPATFLSNASGSDPSPGIHPSSNIFLKDSYSSFVMRTDRKTYATDIVGQGTPAYNGPSVTGATQDAANRKIYVATAQTWFASGSPRHGIHRFTVNQAGTGGTRKVMRLRVL